MLARLMGILGIHLFSLEIAAHVQWHLEKVHGNILEVSLVSSEGDGVYRDQIFWTAPSGWTVENINTYPMKIDKEIYREALFSLSLLPSSPDAKLDFLEVSFVVCSPGFCSFPKKVKLNVPFWKKESFWSEKIIPWMTFWSGAFLGGIATNLTPCVYPMLPITMKILTGTKKSWKVGIFYGLGITIMYTALGLISSYSGNLFGDFHKYFLLRLALALFMVFMSFSFLGNGEFWEKFRALGLFFQKKNSQSSFLWGLGAGFLAAPCTGPILGGLLALSSTLPPWKATSLLFVYSLGFSIPSIFFAGGLGNYWQKVSNPFQEVSKIFLASFLWGFFFSYLYPDLSLLEIFLFAGLIVLLFRKNVYWIHFVSLFLGFSGWYFMNRPFKNLNSHENPSALAWHKTEEEAWEKAKKEKKPILIFFTAPYCRTCDKMKNEVFLDPRMFELLNSYVLLELSSKTSNFIRKRYKIHGIPALFLGYSEMNGKVQHGYLGRKRFQDFLRENP